MLSASAQSWPRPCTWAPHALQVKPSAPHARRHPGPAAQGASHIVQGQGWKREKTRRPRVWTAASQTPVCNRLSLRPQAFSSSFSSCPARWCLSPARLPGCRPPLRGASSFSSSSATAGVRAAQATAGARSAAAPRSCRPRDAGGQTLSSPDPGASGTGSCTSSPPPASALYWVLNSAFCAGESLFHSATARLNSSAGRPRISACWGRVLLSSPPSCCQCGAAQLVAEPEIPP